MRSRGRGATGAKSYVYSKDREIPIWCWASYRRLYIDPPELDELLLLLLPDVDESLQADGVVVGSAEAERSASATNRWLFMTSSASHGLSGGIDHLPLASL